MSDEIQTTVAKKRIAGLLAEYGTPADIMHAAEKVRDAGYTKWDVHTPFPVHGMDGAMGLKPTPMGWISLSGGLTGGSLALLMQWWMNGFDYPLNIGGKPPFAPQAFVPVTFELTILLTAFATLFGMLGLNRLPTLYHWVFGAKNFGRVTDDRFFISIEAEDPKFDRDSTRKLLDKTHPASVEEVEEEIEVSVGALRENVNLTVEALTGITSPLRDKNDPERNAAAPVAAAAKKETAPDEDLGARPAETPAAEDKAEAAADKAEETPPAVEEKVEATRAEVDEKIVATDAEEAAKDEAKDAKDATKDDGKDKP
jgi:hypothetical protein